MLPWVGTHPSPQPHRPAAPGDTGHCGGGVGGVTPWHLHQLIPVPILPPAAAAPLSSRPLGRCQPEIPGMDLALFNEGQEYRRLKTQMGALPAPCPHPTCTLPLHPGADPTPRAEAPMGLSPGMQRGGPSTGTLGRWQSRGSSTGALSTQRVQAAPTEPAAEPRCHCKGSSCPSRLRHSGIIVCQDYSRLGGGGHPSTRRGAGRRTQARMDRHRRTGQGCTYPACTHSSREGGTNPRVPGAGELCRLLPWPLASGDERRCPPLRPRQRELASGDAAAHPGPSGCGWDATAPACPDHAGASRHAQRTRPHCYGRRGLGACGSG